MSNDNTKYIDKVKGDLKEVTRILGNGSCNSCKWLNGEDKCTNKNSPIFGDYPFVLMLCKAYEEGDVVDD